ncbi:hypothetical protein [Paraflavitalea sp. CAU 1676]|uniref:hypothetical protein n=1 Tax=Paraflavitalea sp. CAU 1676 TaxID=3032598 RepID=UPI0023DBEF55|nr:hypothetical protein [Paraflavitalea sp. CAU 1676]MDF2191420.1 hypothetical protein [Paraflavitalea sp. CAU 1676]
MYPFYKLIRSFLYSLLLMLAALTVHAQPCTPQGVESVYGTNNTWIGYVYEGRNFETYKGYINEGNAASATFNETFGGDQVNFATNGCPVYTEEFSVRFRLTKTFANANYNFTVGADDGYRLSLDGGNTWVINRWNDQSYTATSYETSLNGTYDLVVEFYENHGGNRVSFDVVAICTGDGNPSDYGNNNTWTGYLYQGTNFNKYKGYIARGDGISLNFDESFGGSNVAFMTSNCSITTQNFSARFRSKTTLNGSYQFTVGGDDGYRLSLDGGNTWIINRWNDQAYYSSTQTIYNLSGIYDLVLEYYENGGDNRLTFSASQLSLLPVTLLSWNAKPVNNNQVLLNWKTADAVNFHHYIVQKSFDGQAFQNIGQVTPQSGSDVQTYSFTDQQVNGGRIWYRLAMVDNDGSIRYSVLASVMLQEIKAMRVFPTIVENNQVYVESPANMNRALVEWVDMNGRLWKTEQRALVAGRQSLNLPAMAGKATGSYIIRITGENGLRYSQHIIIK